MFGRLTQRVAAATAALAHRRAAAQARVVTAAGARAFSALRAHVGVGAGGSGAGAASARAWLLRALGGAAATSAGVGLVLGTDPARAEGAPAAAGGADAKAPAKKSGTDLKTKFFYTASIVFLPIAAMIRFAGRKTRRGNMSMPVAGWAVSALGYSAVLPEQLSVALAAAGCVFIPLSVGGFDIYTRRTGRTRQVTAMNRFVEGLPSQHPLVWQRLTGAGYPPLTKRPSPELGMPRSYTFAHTKADGSAAELSTGKAVPKVELIQSSRAFDPNYNVNCLFYLNSSHDFARVALRELLKSRARAVAADGAAKAGAGAGAAGSVPPHQQVTPYEVTFGARKYQPFWFWNNRSGMDVTAAEQATINRILATSDSDNRVQVLQFAWAMPAPAPPTAPAVSAKPAYLSVPRPNGADGDQTAPESVIGEWVSVSGLRPATPGSTAGSVVPAWDAIIRGVHGRMIETVYCVDANGGTVVEWIDVRADGTRFLLHGGNAGPLPATDAKAGPPIAPAAAASAAGQN